MAPVLRVLRAAAQCRPGLALRPMPEPRMPTLVPTDTTATDTDTFPPSREAAHARIAAVDPAAYARTRNAIGGAVSGLSPYITHGLVTPREVLTAVHARHPLPLQHRFVMELGWRAYFRHVWQHRGAQILQSLHAGPLPCADYDNRLPADIRQAATGVPVVDLAVQTLYATGMLHNHARLWLASYVVHLRKVHWRCAADWMLGHLLDGDLASNHLSWQWVAGTGSHKPYLFNAENVARHAPAAWHSTGSVIDLGYEQLERWAREPERAAPGRGQHGAVCEPPCSADPPSLPSVRPPDAAMVAGKDVWLVHPWSLGRLPPLAPQVRVLGVYLREFHQAWPWSQRRWRFVGQRMARLTPVQWHGTATAIAAALSAARSVRSVAEPHLAPWLDTWAACDPAPELFAPVAQPCRSFSQWWSRSTCGVASVADLLDRPHLHPHLVPESAPMPGAP